MLWVNFSFNVGSKRSLFLFCSRYGGRNWRLHKQRFVKEDKTVQLRCIISTIVSQSLIPAQCVDVIERYFAKKIWEAQKLCNKRT